MLIIPGSVIKHLLIDNQRFIYTFKQHEFSLKFPPGAETVSNIHYASGAALKKDVELYASIVFSLFEAAYFLWRTSLTLHTESSIYYEYYANEQILYIAGQGMWTITYDDNCFRHFQELQQILIAGSDGRLSSFDEVRRISGFWDDIYANVF